MIRFFKKPSENPANPALYITSPDSGQISDNFNISGSFGTILAFVSLPLKCRPALSFHIKTHMRK
jgi:hypothetical protein